MHKEDRIISEESAYAMMARICSRKEYAPYDIARKLRNMGLSEPVADKIINRLKKEKYVDEKRFIHSYIHDKLRFNKWGKRKIELSLKRKQLPDELIGDLFLEFSEDSLSESLRPILEKKWKTVKGKSDYEKRGKLIRHALGRGFSVDEVMACLEKMRIGDISDGTE